MRRFHPNRDREGPGGAPLRRRAAQAGGALLSRRGFLAGAAALTGLAIRRPGLLGAERAGLPGAELPKVVLVQYGGGVRRRETIEDEATTLSPFLFHRLLPRGTVLTKTQNRESTGHASGSLYLFTGRYGPYAEKPFRPPRLALDPMLPEWLRRGLSLPEEQVLVVHNEQHDTEFLWSSTATGFDGAHRPGLLSIYRVKAKLLARDLEATRARVDAGQLDPRVLVELERYSTRHRQLCYRTEAYLKDCPAIDAYWDRFLAHYEPPGARTREDLAPKGQWESLFDLYDRLLPQGDSGWTTMALRALEELRPRFLTVLLRDVDYVHWGLPYLYQRGIQRMDAGLWEIAQFLDRDPYYRGTTTLIVCPETGRGTSPYKRLPFQHHAREDAGSHELFVYAKGPGIAPGRRVDRSSDIIDVAPTIGQILGCPMTSADGRVLGELFL